MKHVSMIPLIGGFTLGAKEAIGKNPEFILSYPPFNANDSHIVDYLQEVPYFVINPESNEIEDNVDVFKNLNTDIDIVTSVCPCAGLSMLNTSSGDRSGADAPQNDWMYKSTKFVLENLQPKVLVGENAPGLFTKMGKKVADNLYEIGKKFGYSFSLYKTSTSFHGIPQARARTFYFFWKSDASPMLNYYNRDKRPFVDFLEEIPNDASLQDEITISPIKNDISYLYAKHKWGNDFRQVIFPSGKKTIMGYVEKYDLIDEMIDFAKSINHEKGIHLTEHAKEKYNKNMGIWDWSIHIFIDETNAIVGRNMVDAIHPKEDRRLTLRECMHMMGLPSDFQLNGGLQNFNHIAQNVPVPTARDMIYEAMEFINGSKKFFDADYVKQSNINKKIEIINEIPISQAEISNVF